MVSSHFPFPVFSVQAENKKKSVAMGPSYLAPSQGYEDTIQVAEMRCLIAGYWTAKLVSRGGGGVLNYKGRETIS
jgi:hypothetical protein